MDGYKKIGAAVNPCGSRLITKNKEALCANCIL